ncbi:hypothetical protein L2Y90_17325 [Burkholderia pyrrocinia]|uniref:hypothetical protein n=1 Tax=Burkholderia pyrrocinia TaxID=60550 RepID=UPI00215A1268|nr:hypothetical protein [Burkholderia pyrrocinia]UVE68538.1 hypothetical protein L2Y90_17325 [Burkholderia pyrrocinia]
MRDKLSAILIGIIFVIVPFISCATGSAFSGAKSSKLVVDMGGQCVISIKDYLQGYLAGGMPLNASYWTKKPPVKTSLSKFSVNFVCTGLIGKSKEEIARQYGAIYDGYGKKWIPHFESKRDAKLLDKFTKVYNLEAVNGNGFYLIQDDRDGDPTQRERYLSFCIFHEAMAVCGGEPVMYLNDPNGDLLPYVLEVLRSVEFVDTSGSKPMAASVPAAQ